LTVTLLIAAGLLMRSFNLQNVDPGFKGDHLLIAELPMSPKTYAADDVRTNAVEQLLERVRQLPGVTQAAVTTQLPLQGAGTSIHHNRQRYPPKNASDWIIASTRAVSRTYFETWGSREAWSGFTAQDKQGTDHVVVVNEAGASIHAQRRAMGEKIALGTDATAHCRG
jgi:hypothetical protein